MFVQIAQVRRNEKIYMGEGLVQPKFDKFKGGFTNLCDKKKKTYLDEAEKPGELLRTERSSGDGYRIRDVQ